MLQGGLTQVTVNNATIGTEMEIFELPNGLMLRVHKRATCKGSRCVIHLPMATYDRSRLWWRSDRGIFEVICEHGTGHPAPEQYDYWERTDQMWQALHGCCGCCAGWRENE